MDSTSVIEKMISHIEKIQEYTRDLNYDNFIRNEMVIEACAFNFTQLGELSHKLEDGFQQSNPSIPWKAIYGMRNKIVHDYDGINLSLMWETITEDLPELVEQLRKI
ncbi:MAG: HepT-like ribonuclease domain-containing protein [Treponema sp.]|nr:DUF86 domain-containing protein [Treponema sp.]MEE3313580.1 HepT-like ribonuclease domain-containing protein [Treponema sp.]